MSKSLEKMQKEVDEWAHQFEKPYFSQLSMIATMALCMEIRIRKILSR